MTNKYKPISYFLILILTLAVMMTTVSSQLDGSRGSTPSISTQDKDETLSDFIKQNQAVAGDLADALKKKNEENKMMVNDAIDLAQAKMDEGINAIDKVFPNLHIKDEPMIVDIINFIKDYKEVAVLVAGSLVTLFQMVFGGGLSYITSQMKNLSGHKLKIEQGFDLQFQIYRKQEKDQDKSITASKTFQQLFRWLSVVDKKQIKLILGSAGVGFSTNIKYWIQRQKKKVEKKGNTMNYIYYDLSEPAVRANNEAKISHMRNISAIVYSLLHQDDRNFTIRIFKSFVKHIFTQIIKTLELIERNYHLGIVLIITFWALPQVCYTLTLYIIIEILCDFFMSLIKSTKFNFSFDFVKKQFIFKAKSNEQKIKIVIDNFQLTRGEFQDEFMASQIDKNSHLKTFEQHENKFIVNLTDLINDIAALQDLGVEIILIVKNSQFYKRYFERLRLNSANIFKIKRLTQLPSEDSEATIKQRTMEIINVKKQEGAGTQEINPFDLTRILMLFHNNSKELMKILRQVNLDNKYCENDNHIEKTKRQCFSDILDSSMRQVFTHAEKLQLLIKSQQNYSDDKENQFKKYIGLFMGCLHKKVLFFANRWENENNNQKLKNIYQQIIKMFNNKQDKLKPKLLLSISPSNKRYLFEKKNREFGFKKDAKLLLLKWDDLIKYIESHNDWAQSLEEDFCYYFIENKKSLSEAKKIDHRKYHQIYLLNNEAVNNQPIAQDNRVEQHADPLIRYMQNSVASPQINHDLLVNQAKRTFGLIVDFLTEKEVISQHIFFSRSMALANFFVQEKLKEQLLYEHFLMKQCKLLQKIKLMRPIVLKENMLEERAEQFLAKNKQNFSYYVEHQVKSYEQGMHWLRYYFCRSITCNLNPQETQQIRKYLLIRTNNGYFLNNQLSQMFLYWRNFEGYFDKEGITEVFSQDQNILRKVLSTKSTLLTYCALWYFERVTREERFSNNLLGFKFDQLKQPMIYLEKLKVKEYHRKWRGLGQLQDNFRDGLKACMTKIIQYCQKFSDLQNKIKDFPEFDQLIRFKLKQAVENYQLLLKEFKPDELFKQIGLNYRSILYSCVNGRYKLSSKFKNLAVAYNYAKSRPNSINIGYAVQMLLSNQKLIDISDKLTPQLIISLLRNGRQIQEQLKNRLAKDNKKVNDYPLTQQKVLLTDFKYLVAALCWTSGQRQEP